MMAMLTVSINAIKTTNTTANITTLIPEDELLPIEDQYLQVQFDSYQKKIERKMNKTFSVFHASKYATEVYHGINYIIEYNVGDGKTIQINIHVPLAYKDSKPEITEMVDNGEKVKGALRLHPLS